tara:strand:+ start:4 stop:936 length:933 start_codon:yes stop_codon:yes gene_type:complete
MLFDYNINNCGWNNFLDPDWHNITDYKIRYQKPKYINLNYRDELHNAVSALPDDNYAILYSGGIDSAIVMQTFYNCNKTFTPFVAEFWLNGKLLNEYELSFEKEDCSQCNATPVRIKLDVKQILTKELDRLCNIFPTWHPERICQMCILENIPKGYILVSGAGDPTIYIKNKKLYWSDRSYALHLKMYSEYLGLGKCIWGLGFTPELCPSLISNPFIKEWFKRINIDNDESASVYDKDEKMKIYKHYFPEVKIRKKIVACNITSIIKKELPEVMPKIESLPEAWGETCYIPIEDLIKFNTDKIYDSKFIP